MKKFYSIILLICTLISTSCLKVSASDNKFVNYIVLGDSIAYGYQPNDIKLEDGCYSELLKKYFEKNSIKTKYKNYAINGQNTNDLLKQIDNINLKEADIITISIGSNDLLKPFTTILYKELNVTNPKDFITALKKLISSVKTFNISSLTKIYYITQAFTDNQKIFDDAIVNFENTFSKLSKKIRKENPNAKIIVNSIYNPYYFVGTLGIKSFHKFASDVLHKINPILEKVAKENNMDVVNAEFIGEDISYLNINLKTDTLMIDPHPTPKGHIALYNKILENIKNDKDFSKKYNLILSEENKIEDNGEMIKFGNKNL